MTTAQRSDPVDDDASEARHTGVIRARYVDAMRCEAFRDKIIAWLDDRLDAETSASFLAHTTSCSECRDVQRARALLRSIVTSSNRDEMPSTVVQDLLDAARSRKLQFTSRLWQRMRQQDSARLGLKLSVKGVGVGVAYPAGVVFGPDAITLNLG